MLFLENAFKTFPWWCPKETSKFYTLRLLMGYHSVRPPLPFRLFLLGEGVEPSSNFSKKRGDLTWYQILEGGCWERLVFLDGGEEGLFPTLPSQAFSWNPSVVTFESQAFNPKLKPSVLSFPLQNFSRDSSVATFCWQPLSSNTSLRSSWKSSVATVKSRVFCPKPLVETL